VANKGDAKLMATAPEGDDDQALRRRLCRAAAGMIAQACGAQDGQARARQDQEGADHQRRAGAEEQHLDKGIAFDLPLRQRAGHREHHGGAEHVDDAERHAVGAEGEGLSLRCHRGRVSGGGMDA
jgi:hypothetical protein